jgi:heterodisulfide reductase subunit A-like polyferredoxin
MKAPSPTGPHSGIAPTKGIAVFLCGCNGKIGGKISLEDLRQIAMDDERVRSVDIIDDCCCEEGLDRMRLSLLSGDIDRFIVAGCSFKTSGERFERLAASSGIGPSLVEVCNLNEQCALVHEGKGAIEKAIKMLKVSLERSAMLQFVPRLRLDKVERSMLIIGNGHSAAVASMQAVGLGHNVTLACPGGSFKDESHGEEVFTLEEEGFERFCKDAGDRFTLIRSSKLRSLTGGPGRFKAGIETPDGEILTEAGAVIVAMDEEEIENPFKAKFGDRCTDQHSLGEMLRSAKRPKGTIVMLAMDESGESAFDPMSTHEAVHNALYLKGLSPRSDVYIVTREIFALGQCEFGYLRAQESGVRIVRTDEFPDLSKEGEMVVRDVHLGERLLLRYDLIVVDNMTTVSKMGNLASVLGLPLDGPGRFRRPNAKLKPSSSLREGIFLCGTATERSLGIGPTVEAKAAVVRASVMLHGDMFIEGNKAEVWQEKCSACLTCVRTCPYGAPSIDEEGRAVIDVDRCQGCGACVGICPSKAIQMFSFRDDQIEAQIKAALGGAGK